jgi:hypothetical protein
MLRATGAPEAQMVAMIRTLLDEYDVTLSA